HGFTTLDVLDIDDVTVGAYVRNTLRVDKNTAREDALFDIYRVMRPGEPPTVEAAEAMFQSLFFDSERYDLSSVGRVKMNMRLELDVSDEIRVLRKEDVLEVLKTLVGLRDGRGEIDDIDNLGNRRVRSVGELLENSYRVGLLNSLATHARVNKYGFIESPYRKFVNGKASDEVVYLSAMEEAKHTIAQANIALGKDGSITEDLVPGRINGEPGLQISAQVD